MRAAHFEGMEVEEQKSYVYDDIVKQMSEIRIANESKAWLNPGACIYLEIGYDQGEAVSRLLEAAGFCNIQVIKDLPGLDRVVRAEIKK